MCWSCIIQAGHPLSGSEVVNILQHAPQSTHTRRVLIQPFCSFFKVLLGFLPGASELRDSCTSFTCMARHGSAPAYHNRAVCCAMRTHACTHTPAHMHMHTCTQARISFMRTCVDQTHRSSNLAAWKHQLNIRPPPNTCLHLPTYLSIEPRAPEPEAARLPAEDAQTLPAFHETRTENGRDY